MGCRNTSGSSGIPQHFASSFQKATTTGFPSRSFNGGTFARKKLNHPEFRFAYGRNRQAFGKPPQIAGYEVGEVIGHGGMGVVFRAHHIGLNHRVAIKMVCADPHRPDQLARLTSKRGPTPG